VAAHLAACDLAVQPYPDGITARRTTAMAWLAAGVPVVTTGGPLTEPFWAADRPVELAADPAAAAARLLDDPAARAALGGRGRAYYARHFAVGHTVTALLADA
jgi:glycosyltransferase involved in cell wall biosynthesis